MNRPGPSRSAASEFPPTDGPAATRPASLWPETTRPADAPSSSFAVTRFDPMAEERSRLQAQAAAAFDVCHPALALRAVLLVQVALALVALGGAETLAGWGARQAALAFGGVAATLLWLVLVCALRQPLRRVQAHARAAVVLAIGGAASLLAWVPLWWAGLAGDAGGLRVAAVALAGVALAALLWAWLDLRSRIWHPANASARLAELQSRIRPHFLFNALNTALALVRADPGRAEAVLEDLAQLFRVALAEAGASVALEEEIDLARRYLAIEQVRFGARLQVRWQISEDARVAAARVPPLVLQPLVENAVRHGVEPAVGGGRVAVSASMQRGQVVVQVSNTVGSEPGTPGHGMALHNVRERLRLLHDVAAQCDVWREPTPDGELFHARIVLPAP
ncbi:MAG: histidine kinase [Rubrivivax sp.]|nr:histidine kinase [Rubrivivax sp.]